MGQRSNDEQKYLKGKSHVSFCLIYLLNIIVYNSYNFIFLNIQLI